MLLAIKHEQILRLQALTAKLMKSVRCSDSCEELEMSLECSYEDALHSIT